MLYPTNTGYRFVSKGDGRFKIHIHMPDDSVCHRSVGYKKLGEERALRNAVKLRNDIGRKAWGKFWVQILNDPSLIIRLPHQLEPQEQYDNDGRHYYQVMYTKDGERKCFKRSIDKFGKLGAYNQCKRLLMEIYKDEIEIIRHMERFNVVKYQ